MGCHLPTRPHSRANTCLSAYLAGTALRSRNATAKAEAEEDEESVARTKATCEPGRRYMQAVRPSVPVSTTGLLLPLLMQVRVCTSYVKFRCEQFCVRRVTWDTRTGNQRQGTPFLGAERLPLPRRHGTAGGGRRVRML